MSNLTKPASPTFSPGPNPNVSQVSQPVAQLGALSYCVQQLKQATDSLCGFRGKPTNRAVTFDDLADYGLLTDTQASGINNQVTFGGGGGTATTVVAIAPLTGGTITSSGTIGMETIASGHLIANSTTATATPADTSLSALLDVNLGAVEGTLAYRGASGWVGLSPGTSGNYLQTQGSTAIPQWASITAPAVTAVDSNFTLSSGTLQLANIASGSLIANTGTGSTEPAAVSLSALLDINMGATQGAIVYRGASAWVELAPGNSGWVLETLGTAANPAWANPAALAFPISAQGTVQSVGSISVTGTNAGMAIIPNGTGAVMLAFPNGTITGGNARGANAIDLQMVRTAATQVASGQYSFVVGSTNVASGSASIAIGENNASTGSAASIAMGYGNTSGGGSGATAIGNGNSVSVQGGVAIGNSNTATTNVGAVAIGSGNLATASGAVAVGEFNTADGGDSFVFGNRGHANANISVMVHAPTQSNPNCQTEEYVLYNSTSGATAVTLTADGSSAGVHNICNLQANTGATFQVDIVIHDTNAPAWWSYTSGVGLIFQGGSVATTTIPSIPSFTLVGNSAGAASLAAAPTVAADTTNGGITVSYTPPTSNTHTIRSTARVRYVKTT